MSLRVQFSVLSFSVFLFFDIAVNISADTNIPLYADDAKCFRKMLSSDDHDALQKDLHAIEGWSDLWGMFFSASKCKYPSISKMKKPMNLSYQFGNNILAKIQCEKDLGVLVNSKLSWHDHIINKVNTANKVLRLIRRSCGSRVIADVIKKLYVHLARPHRDYACQVLGLIKRSCRDLRDVSTLRTLYCTLVRSQLEYGSVVWSPFTARNITKLERVQRRATKSILKTDDDYDVRISKLNLLSLANIDDFFLMYSFFYKALNGYIDIDMSAYIQF